MTAAHGASAASQIRFWPLPIVITFGLTLGFHLIMTLAVDEQICFDRWPWWGPRRIQTLSRVALGTITSHITSDRSRSGALCSGMPEWCSPPDRGDYFLRTINLQISATASKIMIKPKMWTYGLPVSTWRARIRSIPWVTI